MHTTDSAKAQRGHQGPGWALRTRHLTGQSSSSTEEAELWAPVAGTTAQQCGRISYHSFEPSVKMVNLMFVH